MVVPVLFEHEIAGTGLGWEVSDKTMSERFPGVSEGTSRVGGNFDLLKPAETVPSVLDGSLAPIRDICCASTLPAGFITINKRLLWFENEGLLALPRRDRLHHPRDRDNK